jgi:glycolate oxidase iron-sulfur subunit
MQTHLADWIKDTPQGREAEAILRRCVHCGFCSATCPTYQVLGDELDSPRGRIYLIKQVLEGAEPTASTRLHLDRCLTCRNCETTCPSGVQYGHLVDIGRAVVEERTQRKPMERLARTVLKEGLTGPLFAPAVALGRTVKPMLPQALRHKLPATRPAGSLPTAAHARKVMLLAGCVQPALLPSIDAATARVLDAVGVQSVLAPDAGCCGAVRFHLNDQEGGRAQMRRNVDAWWPAVERGEVEALVMNASGCGATVREYGHHLKDDPAYAEKARRIAELTRDAGEYLAAFAPMLADRLRAAMPAARDGAGAPPAVFHPPCTLQHWQQLRGVTEGLLAACGVTLAPFGEAHLCCGSAGTYSVLQPEIATRLRDRKLEHLQAPAPGVILSANIGCITHLQSGTETPVMHWIEWVDRMLQAENIQ